MTRPALADLAAFIVDLDGTTYLGGGLLPGADAFARVLRRRHTPFLFVTNNSSSGPADYEARLRRLGLEIDDGQVLTSGEATALYLEAQGYRRLFVLGTPALEAQLLATGITLTSEAPDCVVLGFDKTLTYAKLLTASLLLRRGCPFVATHPDVVCPTEDGYIPDCGAMIALLSAATGRTPVVIGKPQRTLVDMALRKLGVGAGQVGVVGDRLYTDIAMGRAAGAFTILVLSGETTMEMVRAAGPHGPDLVVPSLGALADELSATREARAGDVARSGVGE